MYTLREELSGRRNMYSMPQSALIPGRILPYVREYCTRHGFTEADTSSGFSDKASGTSSDIGSEMIRAVCRLSM